ncbi:MAG: hypothetical protein H9791_01670 [Candidatus Bacteroides intestinipullorum]|uniref:Uncharacterized protein n=1 Tax=Candidatus Bacteroides intestinipullorum TaxID=2838471 RepID=A0A9E2KFK7_9BACE|nr:hypothetical protein [Candidatus Bacteroides intestinipullorum]
MEKLRRIIKFALPLIFILYWGGITLFTHTHVVNGVIMVHSHPFKTNHQHSQAEAETILILDHYTTSAIPSLEPIVQCFCILLGVLAIPRTIHLRLPQTEDGIRLRAPPYCVF